MLALSSVSSLRLNTGRFKRLRKHTLPQSCLLLSYIAVHPNDSWKAWTAWATSERAYWNCANLLLECAWLMEWIHSVAHLLRGCHATEELYIVTARSAVRDFWRDTVRKYAKGELPQDFFSKERVWLTRGRTCREYVEPIDIANYYRNGLWRTWLPGRRHYIESDNRPGELGFYTSLHSCSVWNCSRTMLKCLPCNVAGTVLWLPSVRCGSAWAGSSAQCMVCCLRRWRARAEYFVFLEDRVRKELPDEPFVATLPYAQRLADEVDRAQVPKELEKVAACADNEDVKKAVVRTVLLNPVPVDDKEPVDMEQDEFSGAAAEHKAGTVRSSTAYDAATSQCAEDVSTDVCLSPSMLSSRSRIVTKHYYCEHLHGLFSLAYMTSLLARHVVAK